MNIKVYLYSTTNRKIAATGAGGTKTNRFTYISVARRAGTERGSRQLLLKAAAGSAVLQLQVTQKNNIFARIRVHDFVPIRYNLKTFIET